MHREMKTNGTGQDVASNQRAAPKSQMAKFQLHGTCGHPYEIAWDPKWEGLKEWREKQLERACPPCRKKAHEKLMASQIVEKARKKKVSAHTESGIDAPLLLPVGAELTAWHRPDGVWAGTVASEAISVTCERNTVLALVWALSRAWLRTQQKSQKEASP